MDLKIIFQHSVFSKKCSVPLLIECVISIISLLISKLLLLPPLFNYPSNPQWDWSYDDDNFIHHPTPLLHIFIQGG